MEITEFDSLFPYPDSLDISSLFKFTKLDENNPNYLSDILIDKKLYHSTPDQFNDPFECKPNWSLPKNPEKVKKIKKHLIELSIRLGIPAKEAQKLVTDRMKDRRKLESSIYRSCHKSLNEMRICSFTTTNENLLFWSHYAKSHEGICLEFDATKMPFKGAFKVKYQNKYPTVQYPATYNKLSLTPVLTKSREWEYESEFRTVFVPGIDSQPKNDGQSLILTGNELKAVYFGAKITKSQKQKILEMIECGPFKPKLYDANLARSSYSLKFREFKKS